MPDNQGKTSETAEGCTADMSLSSTVGGGATTCPGTTMYGASPLTSWVALEAMDGAFLPCPAPRQPKPEGPHTR